MRLTERIENIEIAKDKFIEEEHGQVAKKKHSEDAIGVIGEIVASGKKKKISEIPMDIMNEIAGNRRGEDKKQDLDGSFIVHESEEDINIFQDAGEKFDMIDNRINEMKDEFFGAMEQMEGGIEMRFDKNEKINQQKLEASEKKILDLFPKSEIDEKIENVQKNFEGRFEVLEGKIEESKIDGGVYVTKEVLEELKKELGSFAKIELMEERIEKFRKEIDESMQGLTGDFLKMEEIKKITTESQQELKSTIKVEIGTIIPMVTDLENKLTTLQSEPLVKSSEIGEILETKISEFFEKNEKFSKIDDVDKIHSLETQIEGMKVLPERLDNLEAKSSQIEQELASKAKSEDLTSLSEEIQSKLASQGQDDNLATMEKMLEDMQELNQIQLEDLNHQFQDLRESQQSLEDGAKDESKSKKEIEEKVKEITAKVEEELQGHLKEFKEKIEDLEEKVEEAEDEREMSENKREKKELERQLNESKREQNEQSRIDEEKQRLKNENIREDKMTSFISGNAEE